MKRHEAEREAQRLNREDPERTRFRWVPISDDKGSWTVYRMARIVRDKPPPATAETASPTEPVASSAPSGSKPSATQPRKRGSRRKPKPRAPGLTGVFQRRGVRVAFLALALAVGAWVLWALRLLIRPLYMTFLVRHPALFSIPLIAGSAAFVVHLLAKVAKRGRAGKPVLPDGGARTSRSAYAGRGRRHAWLQARRALGVPLWRHGPVRSLLVFGGLGFLFAGAMTSAWTGAAIYSHTDYGALALAELHGGQVRIKPYEVAKRQTENGLNSPTEHPTNLHIVKVDGRLRWTSARDPDGLFRALTKPTKGVMSVDATSSGPGVKQSGPRYDADFRYGPGMRISENIRWQVYKKRCYTCDVAEMTALPTAQGPVIVAPYIRYKGGWFVRRPTWGGVYVIHPDGRIEDLSPKQAAARPVLRESGRIYPEKLARRTAEAYKYRRGVWNRLVVHADQLDVADTEKNRQPFLQDFDRLGPQWVTTFKPHGGTFTTAGVMTTDAVSGKSRVWRARRGQALIGNQRATDIVRGESFPGVVFAQPDSTGVNGRFQVVEPRQIFPGGRLQFLLSIIPDSANRVTMSVVVDAASQQVVAKFPASPQGDRDLIAYLRDAQLPAGREGAANGDGRDRQPVAPDRTRGEEGSAPAATLRRLLRENRLEQRGARTRISGLKAQERDLLRLLLVIERGH